MHARVVLVFKVGYDSNFFDIVETRSRDRLIVSYSVSCIHYRIETSTFLRVGQELNFVDSEGLYHHLVQCVALSFF